MTVSWGQSLFRKNDEQPVAEHHTTEPDAQTPSNAPPKAKTNETENILEKDKVDTIDPANSIGKKETPIKVKANDAEIPSKGVRS